MPDPKSQIGIESSEAPEVVRQQDAAFDRPLRPFLKEKT